MGIPNKLASTTPSSGEILFLLRHNMGFSLMLHGRSGELLGRSYRMIPGWSI